MGLKAVGEAVEEGHQADTFLKGDAIAPDAKCKLDLQAWPCTTIRQARRESPGAYGKPVRTAPAG